MQAGPRVAWERISSSYLFNKTVHFGRTFVFESQRYPYMLRRYNSTWKTERVVEVPIVWDIVRRNSGRRILEVGNVLSHYFLVNHDRVDLYEKAPGVINEDVETYDAPPYDLIVSISTLEHVGWNQEPKDAGKILRSLRNLERLTAPGGQLVVTLPIAYNPNVDTYLRDDRMHFTRRYCLKRVSRDNRWEQVDWKEIEHAHFDSPFRRINGLVIGVTDIDSNGKPIA
jgi:SAM-dependent methyltransferase